MTVSEEETDQDMYRDIRKALEKLPKRKEFDELIERIKTLEQKHEKKEEDEPNDEEKTRIVGTCEACGAKITEAQSQKPICLYCGASSTYIKT